MDTTQQARYDRVFHAYEGADGHLSWASFSAHIDVLAGRRNLASDSPEATALRDGLQFWWDNLAAAADSDHDGRVSREEWRTFCAGMTDVVRQTAAAGEDFPLDGWIQALYAIIDEDGDGRITREEYAGWLDALGLAADTDIDAAFAGFDKNEDGWLSWEEFSRASQQYWSDFENLDLPGARWIGP